MGIVVLTVAVSFAEIQTKPHPPLEGRCCSAGVEQAEGCRVVDVKSRFARNSLITWKRKVLWGQSTKIIQSEKKDKREKESSKTRS